MDPSTGFRLSHRQKPPWMDTSDVNRRCFWQLINRNDVDRVIAFMCLRTGGSNMALMIAKGLQMEQHVRVFSKAKQRWVSWSNPATYETRP